MPTLSLQKQDAMKFIALFLFAFVFGLFASGQNTLEFSFTALNDEAYLQLDSVKIMNVSQGEELILHWPDTITTINYQVGIEEYNFQNEVQNLSSYPNPTESTSKVCFSIPENGSVEIKVTDVPGRTHILSQFQLEAGSHIFNYKPVNSKMSFVTIYYNGTNKSVKVLHPGICNHNPSISYQGKGMDIQFKSTNNIEEFIYTVGDTLLYVGYSGLMQSGKIGFPETNMGYSFQFKTLAPCSGVETVTYEGQVYNTIQIYDQCWFKENLNVGTMIQGIEDQLDNDIIEKYCYDNDLDHCTTFGGLYQWDEMMAYNNQKGDQGICPEGWHIPTDLEWKVLEGATDSIFNIGGIEWNNELWRGENVATRLKADYLWSGQGLGTNLFEFDAVGSSRRDQDGEFVYLQEKCFFWTSSANSSFAWERHFMDFYGLSNRDIRAKDFGNSVRCLKDD